MDYDPAPPSPAPNAGAPYGAPADLAVGFDLDMTLVDSSEGIVATVRAAVAERGYTVDDAVMASSIGIPMEDMLAPFLPADLVLPVADRYRELYPRIGVPLAFALPGAAAAFDAVRALHGRVVVVSAKPEPAVRLVLEHVGLQADVVVGRLFAADKAFALREHGVSVYVGDHPGDVLGARAASAFAVAVATGPHDEAALAATGADLVLPGLEQFAPWLAEHVLDQRLADLHARLSATGSLMVAFSGGVDSAFLLAAAVRALGPQNVVAATAVSDSLADGELDQAADLARSLGVRHLTPRTDELSREGYRANAGDRCFFCKAELLDVLGPLATSLGIVAVATGTNADDALAGFRPGIKAAAERGALTPLRDAGFTKAQVRAAAARWDLPTWDKPAAACLSSRIAYGVQISSSGLARVDRAEAAVRHWCAEHGVGVRDLRVRDLGEDRARIELDDSALAALAALEQLAGEGAGAGWRAGGLLADVVTAGFSTAELDPRGFRSGSMNELLSTPERYR
ncbi:ATP-dependent sacrificial sulfur transferase LarE [Angustibacter sp. McL0619]|uniref:ATP-dependent sacrificial sulfur transferase LarE n=1 Tax=Angustibacter sp. McL0619 TaxID=3415676 RepID=UPI003CF8C900